MEFAIGILIAVGVAPSAAAIGLARDRAFYPTALVVIASYYGLFAGMNGSLRALAIEAIPMAVFFGLDVTGFKRSQRLVHARIFDDMAVR
jgi:hypothetical protein